MEEYIQKPWWIRDGSFLAFSPNIQDFIETYSIKDIEKIDLNHLRNYYTKDKMKGINLIDELTLRGFRFFSHVKSSLLPDASFNEEDSFIVLEEDGTSYRNIDFKRLGLSNFIERFNVNSDYFFQFIKLDYFLYLNKGLHLRLLREELSKGSFKLLDSEKLKTFELSVPEGAEEDLKVELVYGENGFSLFRSHCDWRGITYMGELENFDFENLIYQRGFGQGKVKKIIERYNEFLQDKTRFIPKDITQEGRIEDVFSDNIFYIFRKYCSENNLLYMDQLRGFSFETLLGVKGFGVGKVNKVMERYKEFMEKASNGEGIAENGQGSAINIDDYYKDLPVEGLKALGVKDKVISYFKENNMETIEDALKHIVEETPVDKINVSKFKESAMRLKMTPEDLYLEKLGEIKKDKNFDVYRKRSVGKLTLQEIGLERNSTRERVRQIEAGIVQDFRAYFLLFENFLITMAQSEDIVGNDDLAELYEDEDVIYIKYALEFGASKRLDYFKEIDKFLVDKEPGRIKEALDNMIEENLPEVFNFYENLLDIEEMLGQNELDFIDVEDFSTYLAQRGYKTIGNYMWKGAVPLRRIYNFIVREHFPKGIKATDSENIQRVRELVKAEFGIDDLTESDRAIESAIAMENVLCDRGSYIHPDHIRVQPRLLEKIVKYIKAQEQDMFVIADIYSIFEKELLESTNIDNRYFFHGVLRYYYNDEFTFSRDNLSKRGGIVTSNVLLENYLLERGCAVPKDELKKKFPGWTEIMFSNAVQMNENIINWDMGYFMNAQLLDITDKDRENLRASIEKALENGSGYTNSMIIFKTIRLSMNDFFKRNGIKNYFNLFSILENLFKEDFYFRRPHILREKTESQFTSMELFYNLIHEREKITYEEFKDYFLKLKFKESTIYDAFRKVSEELMKIGRNEYVLKKNIKLTGENIARIKSAVEGQFGDKEYLPTLSIKDFRDYPDIGCEWNPYLLEGIVKEYIPEFRIVEKDFKDRRYRCSTLVRKDSKLKNITDLIIYVIEKEYKDRENMTLYKVQDFLITKDVIMKTLPIEVLESGRVSLDEYNRISIKGEEDVI